MEQLPVFKGIQPVFKTITVLPAQVKKIVNKESKILKDFNEIKV